MEKRVIAWPILLAAGGWMLHAGRKVRREESPHRTAAFIDSRALKPGTFRKITADALPQPFATSSSAISSLGSTPRRRLPQAPPDSWSKYTPPIS
jgi:hypothetical protein